MRYTYFFREEYDKKVKLNKVEFFYSSDEQTQVVGEITGKLAEQGEPSISIKGNNYLVTEYKKKSRILYKELGYVDVGGGNYIAVMKNRLPIIIILIGLLTLLLLAGIFLPKLFGDDVPVSGEIPDIDPNAVIIDEGDKAPSSGGGGSVTMEYTLTADLDLATNNIAMHFKNPSESNHGVSLDLYVLDGSKSYLVASSGRINPGSGIFKMTYVRDYAILNPGAYNAMYVVHFYDPQTGEKALVQSNITDVVISVS